MRLVGPEIDDLAHLYIHLVGPKLSALAKYGEVSSGSIFTLVFSAILLLIEFFERKSGVVFKWNTISPLTIFFLFQVFVMFLIKSAIIY
jgi:hypothetical protein